MSIYRELCQNARLTPTQAAELFGLSTRTIYRRLHDPRTVPESEKLALLLLGGYLDALGWRGWRMIDGELFPPASYKVRRGIPPEDCIRLVLLRSQKNPTLEDARVILTGLDGLLDAPTKKPPRIGG